MNRELERIIAGIRNGNGPSLVLLFGDDFEVQEACKRITDLIVPASARGFNLERFDGRSAAWGQIQASLDTPPFLPGKKVVWVENSPYFLSREQSRELGGTVVQLWVEGKKDDACELLMELLKVEGWSKEQWEHVQSGSSPGALSELLGSDREAAEQLLAHCRSRGLDFAERRASDGHGLLKLLDQGLPPWVFLLLTASQIDRRTRLYKRFEETGVALYLGLERDRSGRVSRESLTEFINQRLGQAGKTIGLQAREMILVRAGEELRGVQQELEKLLLYVGGEPTISARDVEAIFTDQGAGWVFDLTRSIAHRDAVAALSHLGRLLAQGEHALKVLGTIASDIRKLLAARQLIDRELGGRWKRGMTYQQFQRTVIAGEAPLLTRNPYADYICFQRAENFSLGDLRSFLAQIYDADLRLKSSGNQPRLVMEKLVLNMCLGIRGNRRLVEHRAKA
ncbi:MAG: DNA polymerase III subunit delta [Candidatus Binatia bacterium]